VKFSDVKIFETAEQLHRLLRVDCEVADITCLVDRPMEDRHNPFTEGTRGVAPSFVVLYFCIIFGRHDGCSSRVGVNAFEGQPRLDFALC
jgi:hypothetical protein